MEGRKRAQKPSGGCQPWSQLRHMSQEMRLRSKTRSSLPTETSTAPAVVAEDGLDFHHTIKIQLCFGELKTL